MNYWNKSDEEVYSEALIYTKQSDGSNLEYLPTYIPTEGKIRRTMVTNADDILKSFLESKTRYGPQKTKLLIGAPFGVSKTSLEKKWHIIALNEGVIMQRSIFQSLFF